MAVAWMKRSVIREFPAALKSPGFHFVASRLQRVVLTRIHARQDSIDLPWSIDPTSEAVFGELDGELSLPMKFAEAFGFGRAINITGGRQDA
jgi:hypothetical protein